MVELSNDFLLLKELTIADAKPFYELYRHPEIMARYPEPPASPGENPVDFITKIIKKCDYIWTIRRKARAENIIGDIALHDRDPNNNSIEIGGTLLPEYWGQGLIQQAFSLVLEFAGSQLNVTQVIARTTPGNKQAVRMAEKSGFIILLTNEKEIVLTKKL